MTGPAADLSVHYRSVRAATEALAAPLSAEDQTPQSMPDASPVKWHRAHTTWFFETFVLEKAAPGYVAFDPAHRVLFNSYYNAIGEQYPRGDRGLITRPGVAEVGEYRAHVDETILGLLDAGSLSQESLAVVELGLHHEQQHQELLVTDLKHLFGHNPLHPAYRERAAAGTASELSWRARDRGLHEIGHQGDGFHYDNEGPRHAVHLEAFELATRPVTNGEWLEFMESDGYARPELWLSDGWSQVQTHGWRAPLYWVQRENVWHQYTLAGLQRVDPDEPVTHVSAYEADAYASFADARLPTEAEWEVVAAEQSIAGNFVESGRLHPTAADGDGLVQVFGDVWEWTRSAYSPYPGFAPAPGALGEYNGKFMANQLVLRGGSCVTPGDHVRATYRNFFYPDARWQFSGVRLARDIR
jgi:ergothioneine biosynthesis protein EgtB